MTPDLSRELGRLLSLSTATPMERGTLIRASAPPSVKTIEDLPTSAMQLVADLQQRVESRARNLKHLSGQHDQQDHIAAALTTLRALRPSLAGARLRELDAIIVDLIGMRLARGPLKHLAGQHDQSSHGRRRTGTLGSVLDKLESLRDKLSDEDRSTLDRAMDQLRGLESSDVDDDDLIDDEPDEEDENDESPYPTMESATGELNFVTYPDSDVSVDWDGGSLVLTQESGREVANAVSEFAALPEVPAPQLPDPPSWVTNQDEYHRWYNEWLESDAWEAYGAVVGDRTTSDGETRVIRYGSGVTEIGEPDSIGPDISNEGNLQLDDPGEAGEFVRLLRQTLAEAAPAKSHRRAHVKHLPGQHNQDSHGGDGVPNVLDKLKLASRIQLGPGEKLLSSRRFKSSSDDGRNLLAAEVEMPGGREVRLGLVDPDEARHWTAASNARLGERLAEVNDLMADLDEEDDAWDELDAERDALRDALNGNNPTVAVAPEGVAAMRAEIAAGIDSARAWSDDYGARSPAVFAAIDAIYGPHRDHPSQLTPEERAQVDRLYEEIGDPDPHLMQGAVPVPGGASLAYQVVGDADTEGRPTWRVEMAIRHPDADEGWYIGANDDAAIFPEKDVKALLAGLEELASGTAKAATRHPHTTRSRDMLTLRAPLKNAQPDMAFKSFDAAIKAVDDAGTATIVIATLNEVDKDGDVTLPGFFGKQHTQMVPVHDWNHVPIGKGVVYESGNQVLADVKFNLGIQAAKDWHSAIDFDFKNPPALQQYSYGYTVKEGGSERGSFKGQSVRFLKGLPDGTPGVDVHEVSPVLVGAGNGTRTAAVKAHLRPARPARFTDEAHAVLASVQALSARAADVMAMRQAKGKRFGVDSAGLLSQIEAELKALQSVLAEPDAPADVLEQVLLNSIARRYR